MDAMKMSDMEHILQQNPKLLPLVYSFDGMLDKVNILPPDSTSPRYDSFCAKLSIKEKPWLIIYDDDLILNSKEGNELLKRISGGYDEPGNAVVLKRSVFEAFSRDKKTGNYVVSHELGHAKNLQNRRHFLRNAAGVVGSSFIGLGAMIGIQKAGDVASSHLEPSPAESFKAPAESSSTAMPSILGILVAAKSHNKILQFFARDEEFAADNAAAEAISPRNVIIGLAQNSEEAIMEQGNPQIIEAFQALKREYLQKLAQSVPDATEDDKNFYWAVNVAAEWPKRPLASILRNPYPTNLERIRNMAQHPEL